MSENIIAVEVWVKRSGVRIGQLDLSTDSPLRVTCTADAEIKMRMNCNAYWDQEFDYNTDTLIPVLITDGIRKEVGEYIITASRMVSDGLAREYQLTGFDLTYRAKKRKIEERVFFAKGTLYIDAINQLIVQSGITDYQAVPSSLVFATDREDWDPGTPYITIINQLLEEINYNTLYMDLDGIVQVTPYKPANIENVSITYYDDEATSILIPGTEIEIDGFDHPNVFHYICDNPDSETSLHVISENSDPSNRFSIPRQGRVPTFIQMDNVPDETTLQAIADKARLESMISSDLVTFQTEQNPIHNPFEIVAIRSQDFNGILAETEWELELGVEGSMTHTGRRSQYT